MAVTGKWKHPEPVKVQGDVIHPLRLLRCYPFARLTHRFGLQSIVWFTKHRFNFRVIFISDLDGLTPSIATES